MNRALAFLLWCCLSAAPSTLFAQSDGFVWLEKWRNYVQVGPDEVMLQASKAYAYDAGTFLPFLSPTSVTLTGPGRFSGGVALAQNAFFAGEWLLDPDVVFVDSQGEVDQGLPEGAYTLTFTGDQTLGEVTLNLNLNTGAYPNPPVLLNFAALDDVSTVQPLVLQWLEFSDRVSDSAAEIFVRVYRRLGDAEHLVFDASGENPNFAGLQPTAESISVPIDLIGGSPSGVYTVEVVFYNYTGAATQSVGTDTASLFPGYRSATRATLYQDILSKHAFRPADQDNLRGSNWLGTVEVVGPYQEPWQPTRHYVKVVDGLDAQTNDQWLFMADGGPRPGGGYDTGFYFSWAGSEDETLYYSHIEIWPWRFSPEGGWQDPRAGN